MRIVIACIGRLKNGPERDLFERYKKRADQLARQLGIRSIDLIELDEARDKSPAERQNTEAKALQERLSGCSLSGCSVIVFDERGTAPTSCEFAGDLGRYRDANRDLALVIGGPDGLADRLRDGAAKTVSFGAMTLPHQLVRVAVMEQVYRALTILSGHPYHRR